STEYPRDGRVRIEVLDAPADAWELTVRIPGWADGATVDVGDGPRPVGAPAFVHRGGLRAGAVVELDLRLAPRWVYPDERIDAVRGCVALERGPLVMCLESVDQPGGADVARLRVDPSVEAVERDGRVVAEGRVVDLEEVGAPYTTEAPRTRRERAELTLVPYHPRGNRGPSTMRVWVPAGS